MAKPTKKYLLQLVAQHGPEIAKAFKESLASIKGSAQVGALITMLEKGDIEGAMVAVGLEPASFRRLDQSISNAFEDGGGKTAQTIPAAKTPDGLRMVVQFNARNDRAEQWLKDHSSTLIREILDDQRQVIRQTLADGLARGQNPKTIARALIGNLDKATGRRIGGTIGLTAHQQQIAANYLDELLSGDPTKMRNALARALRDPKFDGAIRRAIAAGEPLDADMANKAVARYRDRQLVLRAETIGRTEAMTALHQSQEEAYQQAIDKGALQAQHVRYFWRTAADERVRHSHAMIPGMNEKGVPHGQPFSSPLGPIRYPGDPKASAANRINCFAPWTKISPLGLKGAISRHYVGDLVEVAAGREVNLAVTPNHPILTQRGWVPAGEIVEGDNLVYRRGRKLAAILGGAGEPKVDHADAAAEHVYGAAEALGCKGRAPRGDVNFHGEVPSHDVDIVAVPRALRDASDAASFKLFGNISLAETDVESGRLLFGRLLGARKGAEPRSADSLVRSTGPTLSSFSGSQRRAAAVPLGDGRGLDADVVQACGNHRPSDAKLLRDGQYRVPRVKEAADIGVVPFSRLEMGPLGSLPFGRADDAGLGGIDPHIEQALLDDCGADADGLGDGGQRSAGPTQISDFGVVDLALLQEALGSAFSRRALDAGLGYGLVSEPVAHPGPIRGLSDGEAGSVEVQDLANSAFSRITVTEVRRFHYSGPVYNFETANGLILAENIVTHNCRCWREPKVDFLAQAVEAERGPVAGPSAGPRAPVSQPDPPEHSWPWTPRPRQSPVDLKMIRNPEEFGLFADEAGALRLANELMAGVPETIKAHASWTNDIPYPGADPELKFRLREDDVTLVRTFKRENNRLIVEHDYFELDEKYKGGGHAIRMLQASLAAYDRLGVNEIRVHANLDMGGYVWARNGFRANDPSMQRLVFKDSARRQLRQGLMTEARFAMLMEVLNTSSDLELMYNIAVLKDNGVEFGKQFLLESDWWGLADLDDPEHRALLAKAVSR